MGARVVEVAPERYHRWRARFDALNPDGPQRVLDVSRFDHDPLAVLLVRRGGYAVGVVSGPTLTTHKVGTRYVQSRTAAGGWSQQRFARRRSNQADELVGAVTGHAVRLLAGSGARGLVIGGDRVLATGVLEDERLAMLRDLPRRELFDLPDPRLAVLQSAARRARAVLVTIQEP